MVFFKRIVLQQFFPFRITAAVALLLKLAFYNTEGEIQFHLDTEAHTSIL